MALKLEGEYEITLSAGGIVTGKLVDDGSGKYGIRLTWSPASQDLSPADGVKLRDCQDALRLIAIQLAQLTTLEI